MRACSNLASVVTGDLRAVAAGCRLRHDARLGRVDPDCGYDITGFNFLSHGSQDLYPTYLKDAKLFSDHNATVATIIGNCVSTPREWFQKPALTFHSSYRVLSREFAEVLS